MTSDFAATRKLFCLPDGIVYLDGNSLGPLPVGAEQRLAQVLTEEWGQQLIRGWNDAGWYTQPRHVGDRIAELVGAAPGSVVMGDTLSIKIYQALAAALALRPDRRRVLTDTGNFPTDLYIAQGLLRSLGRGHELKMVAPGDVADHLTDEVAVLLLTQVDYRSGRMHDLEALTALAHDHGVITVWDLAHSAGAVPVDLGGADVDFAAGCTYKYLNGGPGAPAFIHVAPRLADTIDVALSGWMGHADPFAFEPDYRPAGGIERLRVGTPPVLALSVLDTALDVWDEVDLADVRERSVELSERFIAGVVGAGLDLMLASPTDPAERGSQVSFRCDQGYAVMQALIDRGVIGDFREPDIIRFGITPLYLDDADIDAAVEVLCDVMAGRLWDHPHYHERSAVT